MNKKLKFLVFILVFALSLLFGFEAYKFIEVDKCLDKGGRYSYKKRVCEFQ